MICRKKVFSRNERAEKWGTRCSPCSCRLTIYQTRARAQVDTVIMKCPFSINVLRISSLGKQVQPFGIDNFSNACVDLFVYSQRILIIVKVDYGKFIWV